MKNVPWSAAAGGALHLTFGGNHTFPGGSDSKELPAMEETWVQSLGWEDSLRRQWQTTPVVLAWRIPWTAEPGGLHSMCRRESVRT